MPLKWGNVTGASTNAGSASLRDAGSLFGKAFDSFEQIARDKQTNLEEQNTAQALDELRQLSTVEDFDASEGTLSTEALTQRFGAGNFNAEAVSKLRDTARQGIVEQGRSDLEFQQGQAAVQQKLLDDQTRRETSATTFQNSQTLFQQDQANKQGQKNAIATAESILTPFEQGQRNDEIHDRAIVQFEKEFPGRKGAITRDKFGKINFARDSNITAEEILAFTDIAKSEGFEEIQTFSESLNSLDAELENIPAEFRSFARKQFRDRYNETKLSNDDQVRIDSFKAHTAGTLKEEIALEKSSEVDLLKSINDVKNPAEQAQEQVKLNDYLLNIFPESHANFLGIGNQEGGTELVNQVAGMIQGGIQDENGNTVPVEPWMIYEVLGTAADFEKEILDNKSVDLNKLEEGLLKVAKSGTVGTSAGKRRAVRVQTMENIRRLKAQSTAASATFEREVKQDNKVINIQRNKQLYDNTLRDAVARARKG